MKISRRQFLFGSATIAALTTAAITIPQLGGYPSRALPFQVLSDREAHIYHILGEWFLPKGGPLPGSGGDDETLLRIDAMFIDIPKAQRRQLLDRFASKRLTALSAEAREQYLQNWTQSNNIIRMQLLAAIKTMYAFSYFERLDVLNAMGLSPHCRISS